jgi:hypothetical protein
MYHDEQSCVMNCDLMHFALDPIWFRFSLPLGQGNIHVHEPEEGRCPDKKKGKAEMPKSKTDLNLSG